MFVPAREVTDDKEELDIRWKDDAVLANTNVMHMCRLYGTFFAHCPVCSLSCMLTVLYAHCPVCSLSCMLTVLYAHCPVCSHTRNCQLEYSMKAEVHVGHSPSSSSEPDQPPEIQHAVTISDVVL